MAPARGQCGGGLAALVPPVVRGLLNGGEGHRTDSGRSMDGRVRSSELGVRGAGTLCRICVRSVFDLWPENSVSHLWRSSSVHLWPGVSSLDTLGGGFYVPARCCRGKDH